MFHLKKYKSAKLRETLLYIAGAGIMAGGVASLVSNTSNVPEGESPKMTGSFVIIGVGFGTLITNYLISLNKGKHIEQAIEAYN